MTEQSGDYLVQARLRLPGDMASTEREALLEAEYDRAAELAEAGTLRGIWRVPGARANVAIWSANSATELHEILSNLPLFPWMEITVTALAEHPVAARTDLGR